VDLRQAARRLEEAQRTGAEVQEDLRAKRLEVDHLDLELKGHEEKIKRLTVQLNTVKTNKEYAALQHEIAGHKADASLLEDRMLALMEDMDRAEAARVRHESRLESERRKHDETREHVERETAALDAKIADLARRREALMGEINKELRDLYQGLLAKRDGRAMVRAAPLDGDNRSCSGCFMRLTSNTTSRLAPAPGRPQNFPARDRFSGV